MGFTKLDYCQYLLSSQVNYTITNLADHFKKCSHDTINRYLRREKLTPHLIWENVKNQVKISEKAAVIFDDTVLDKSYSKEIEISRRQYSGNEHQVIEGIGLVNCLYVNRETQEFWIIDYRIYDPESDGKSKLAHVKDILTNLKYHKEIPFSTVLMDAWYATSDLMKFIDELGKIYYCPLKKNRLVDDTDGVNPYQRIENRSWSKEELKSGKLIKIKKFPQNKKVKLFRVEVSTDRTDFIATNDKAQDSTEVVQKECGLRWKVEEFHREIKQLTGIDKCQCRKGRIQRNHISCAILVWVRLKHLARKTHQTVYQIKYNLLGNYLTEELCNPSVAMTLV